MLLAVSVVAIDPVSVTGYFYHPLMIGVVHLVTLGWISGSILGACFIVGPPTLRMPMPVGRLDYWAFAFYTIGWAAWMRRHPRPSPPARPRPDWGVFHALQSLAYLAIASGIGLTLVVMPTTAWTARLSMLYGIVALIGFLSQVVIGMEHRILPLFEWHTRFRASGFGTQPPPTHVMGSQPLRAAVFGLWTVGMPVLAVGMSAESSTVVGIGGWVILGAVMLHTMNTIRTLRAPALAIRQDPPATRS